MNARRRAGAGSVEIRGRSWEIRYKDPQTGRRTRKVLGRTDQLDRDAACRLADEFLFGLTGRPAPGTSLDLGALVDRLERDLRGFLAPSALAPRLRFYRGVAAPYFGARPVGSIDRGAAQDFVSFLRERPVPGGHVGHKPNTVRVYAAYLRSLWDVAADRRLVRGNPWRGLRLPRATERKIRPADAATLDALLGLVPDLYRPFLAVLAETGLRRGEAADLRWGDVLEDRIDVEASKTGRGREVPLTGRARAVFARLRFEAGRPSAGERVFDGMYERPGQFRAPALALQKACDRLKIRRMTLHDLRHSFACRLVAAGAPEPEIASVLGHRNVETTRRYTQHGSEAAAQRAIGRLDAHESPPGRAAGAG